MARMTLGLLLPEGMAIEEALRRVQEVLDRSCDAQGIPRGRVTARGAGRVVEAGGLPEEAANRLKAGHPVLAEPLALVEE